jgi:hypothetical protein
LLRKACGGATCRNNQSEKNETVTIGKHTCAV